MVKPEAKKPLVFITGASSGLGQALAAEFHRQGWRLALSARRSEDIQAWAEAQGWQPQDFSVYRADVSQVDEIVAAAEACLSAQGLPEVVVANAGISVGMDSSQRADLEVLAQVLAINNVGLAATFQAFIEPMMARGRGALVGIGSVAGIRGLPGHGAYCASKAGVIAYCESLRGELRSSGVKVLTVCPGYIDTPLTRGNRYHMPFLMSADDFAAQAFKAISRGDSYRVIPWQMGLLAKFLRCLPNAWFDRLLARRPRKQRRP